MFQRRIRYSIPDTTNKLNHIDLEEKLEFNDRAKKGLATLGDRYLSNSQVKTNYLLHSTHTHIVSLLQTVRCLQPKTWKLIMKSLEIGVILSRYPNKQLHHLLYQILFTIMGIIFYDFWIFYQMFFSPQVKRSVIIGNKHGYTSCITSCWTT